MIPLLNWRKNIPLIVGILLLIVPISWLIWKAANSFWGFLER
jgi:hypothetical protein